MVFSYSAALASAPVASASTSTAPAAPADAHNITHLVLDAGPLLSLAPLRHLAATFHTTPAVLAELRDARARAHWDALRLAGVDVRVEQPSAEAVRRVTDYARKSGDHAVLSSTDVGVVALTWMWEVRENGESMVRRAPGEKLPREGAEGAGGASAGAASSDATADEGGAGPGVAAEGSVDGLEGGATSSSVEDSVARLALSDDAAPEQADDRGADEVTEEATPHGNDEVNDEDAAVGDAAESEADDSDASDASDASSDGGDWITPANVKSQRSQDLGLLPSGDAADDAPVAAACMTGDYAVQNVLLGMGLGLVGEGGKRIGQVRSWVLRCHACFKICKDSGKRFCPSCGNATLLRATVSTSAETGEQTVHLKRNFQYRTRGTKYSIPEPKPGRAKGQQKGGSGLILREDQAEWQEAVRGEKIRHDKEERRAARGVGGWDDPDWLPEIVTVGMSGKGRSGGHGLPSIGHGRKNPNHARRKR